MTAWERYALMSQTKVTREESIATLASRYGYATARAFKATDTDSRVRYEELAREAADTLFHLHGLDAEKLLNIAGFFSPSERTL